VRLICMKMINNPVLFTVWFYCRFVKEECGSNGVISWWALCVLYSFEVKVSWLQCTVSWVCVYVELQILSVSVFVCIWNSLLCSIPFTNLSLKINLLKNSLYFNWRAIDGWLKEGLDKIVLYSQLSLM